MPRLKYFALKAFINGDNDLIYLKWLLNGINFVQNLKLLLKSDVLVEARCSIFQKLAFDANFIRQYCLPDSIPNLIDFQFYICFERQLSIDQIEKITNSFQTHRFFVDRQWTNVKCLFDRIKSCQHLISSFNHNVQFNDLTNYSYIFNWLTLINDDGFSLYPTLHLFLDQFDQLYSSVSYLNISKECSDDFEKADFEMSLKILLKIKQNLTVNNPFRNVTKIQFGAPFDRTHADSTRSRFRNEIREKVLAHLISMTVQLKCLLIEQFHWLFHTIENRSNELRIDALHSIQYIEFTLLDGYYHDNDVVNVGCHLVPFLSTYIPHLQTLRIHRPHDFSWTSTLPNCPNEYTYRAALRRRYKFLRTPQTIAEHTSVFKHDLSQLVENLKQLTYLEIFSKIYPEKVESYRLMTQTLFPCSLLDIEVAFFRLWL